MLGSVKAVTKREVRWQEIRIGAVKANVAPQTTSATAVSNTPADSAGLAEPFLRFHVPLPLRGVRGANTIRPLYLFALYMVRTGL